MNQQNARKRRVGTAGVKALIAAASVAATLVGWALLPANDPQATAATADQPGQQTLSGLPGTTDNGLANGSPGLQAPTAPDGGLPQVTFPNGGFSQSPRPFTRSHSSR